MADVLPARAGSNNAYKHRSKTAGRAHRERAEFSCKFDARVTRLAREASLGVSLGR